jgi:uncharacterized protein
MVYPDAFSKLLALGDRECLPFVADASNLDDCLDYWPGRKAVEEAGIRSPLREAKLRKDEIRILSREMGLPTWDMPSMACLVLRFHYWEVIKLEKLRRADEAEGFLRDLGFRQVRVRSHDI